ncbi:phosphodiester glycosidase family protein [Candidatus Roizmanbacteria bacterium]|nr:phosphodiester glycosidase family protein [Candidatus Roizmanbacteria bacterium]
MKLPHVKLDWFFFVQVGGVIIASILALILVTSIRSLQTDYADKTSAVEQLTHDRESLEQVVDQALKRIETLESEDQYVVNQQLKKELANIKKTYTQAVAAYEDLVKLREQTDKTQAYDDQFTQALTFLAEENWASGGAELTALASNIKKKQDELAAAAAPAIPQNVPQNNAPPGSGYSRQQVATEIGNYMVSLVAGDLSSTRIIVDTASDGTCGNECPVLPLGDYVARSGAYAGINGSYFCPKEYPSCAGKTNSFDTLLMNKNKVYFNSDNNVYSTVPVVIFGGGWVRFEGQSLNWGRDTGVDGVIANQPLLVAGGNVVFGGDGDPKKGSKGGRSFVANKGNIVYIGVVHSATVAEAAIVLKTLGMDNALNLDDGGSTALWSGGYKVGPGRSLPNVILFVRK